jgi:hypothetical protein
VNWTQTSTGMFVLAYLVSVWFLSKEAKLEGWAPFGLALIPAAIIGAYWRQGLVLVGICLVIYLVAKS